MRIVAQGRKQPECNLQFCGGSKIKHKAVRSEINEYNEMFSYFNNNIE
jgi:hypothetical protein